MARPGRRSVAAPLLALCLAVLIAAVAAVAAEPKFPALTGRVVDEAGILSAPARQRISAWLEQYERESKRQVVVATVKGLQGYPIEDYGTRLGRHWGIGEKDRNTGAILLVAPNERAVRIEVGYGLEGELTDAISRVIVERVILPEFRQGRFEQGIVAGTAAILQALGWRGAPAPAVTRAPARPVDAVPLIAFQLFFFAFVVFFVVRLIRSHGGHGPGIGPHSGPGVWGRRTGSSTTWGGGSFGSGGGSFGGGGGSFGGGGATGRW